MINSASVVRGFICALVATYVFGLYGYLFNGGMFAFGSYYFFGGNVVLDAVGYLLSLTSILIWFTITFRYHKEGFGLVTLSALSSVVCFMSNNAMLFWFSYEVSILSLLFRIFVESPYSERYKTIWYLTLYSMGAGVPMIISIIYLGEVCGSYNIGSMRSLNLKDSWLASYVLFTCFIAKIPWFPFHGWLPVVHAEASTIVSVCLSGYVMKLGVCGLYRFCSGILHDVMVSPYGYIVVLVGGVYVLKSVQDNDSKSWLAYTSLAHMCGCCYSLCVVDACDVLLPVFICVGHGLSSAICFLILDMCQNLSNSRGWFLVKSTWLGSSILGILLMTTLAIESSAPPTTSFFCELLSLVGSVHSNMGFTMCFLFYVFCLGAGPLVFLCWIVVGPGYPAISSRECHRPSLGAVTFLMCLFIVLTAFMFM